jgi:hypothetical protein
VATQAASCSSRLTECYFASPSCSQPGVQPPLASTLHFLACPLIPLGMMSTVLLLHFNNINTSLLRAPVLLQENGDGEGSMLVTHVHVCMLRLLLLPSHSYDGFSSTKPPSRTPGRHHTALSTHLILFVPVAEYSVLYAKQLHFQLERCSSGNFPRGQPCIDTEHVNEKQEP